MQICQQVLHLLLREDLPEARHGIAPIDDNFAHPFIGGRQTAFMQKRMLEHSLQAWAFLSTGRVRLMTAVTIVVVKLASGGLLPIQPKFGIALAQLRVASGEKESGAAHQP